MIATWAVLVGNDDNALGGLERGGVLWQPLPRAQRVTRSGKSMLREGVAILFALGNEDGAARGDRCHDFRQAVEYSRATVETPNPFACLGLVWASLAESLWIEAAGFE